MGREGWRTRSRDAQTPCTGVSVSTHHLSHSLGLLRDPSVIGTPLSHSAFPGLLRQADRVGPQCPGVLGACTTPTAHLTAESSSVQHVQQPLWAGFTLSLGGYCPDGSPQGTAVPVCPSSHTQHHPSAPGVGQHSLVLLSHLLRPKVGVLHLFPGFAILLAPRQPNLLWLIQSASSASADMRQSDAAGEG